MGTPLPTALTWFEPRCETNARCSRCDHGQIYCGKSCSSAVRFKAQRAAGQRYQSSGIGRINHIERTRRWRLRQKEQRGPGVQGADPVTHQGSLQAPTDEPVLSSNLSAGVQPLVAVEIAQTQRFCPECAAALDPWVRLGFVNRRCARASLRSGKARASTDEADAGPSPRSLSSKAQNRALDSE